MKRKYYFNIISLTLLLVQLINPVTTFAKNDYVNNDFCDEYYWSDISGINLNDNNGFSGVVKYICDEENGEFYLYFSFYDKNLNTQSNDKITIGITVTNKNSKQLICVDENGFTDDSSLGAEDFAQIYYSFEQASAIRKGGTLYVGFKLKNSEDKQQINYISCDYYFGDYIIHNLLTDVTMDMSKNSETKKDSASTASANDNSDSINDTLEYEKESQTEESSKFAGSGKYIQNDDKSEEKYESNEKSNSISDNGSYENNEKYQPQADEESTDTQEAQVYNYSSQHSLPAKIMIGVGTGIIALGVVCTATGIITSKKNPSNTDNTKEK